MTMTMTMTMGRGTVSEKVQRVFWKNMNFVRFVFLGPDELETSSFF